MTDILKYHYTEIYNEYMFKQVYRCIIIMILDDLYQLGNHKLFVSVKMVILMVFLSIK